MKKQTKQDRFLPEYDFSKGVRGKYAKRYRQGSNIVVIDPDLVSRFPNASAVNRDLRTIVTLQRRRRTEPAATGNARKVSRP
jgi:hypothetical protein